MSNSFHLALLTRRVTNAARSLYAWPWLNIGRWFIVGAFAAGLFGAIFFFSRPFLHTDRQRVLIELSGWERIHKPAGPIHVDRTPSFGGGYFLFDPVLSGIRLGFSTNRLELENCDSSYGIWATGDEISVYDSSSFEIEILAEEASYSLVGRQFETLQNGVQRPTGGTFVVKPGASMEGTQPPKIVPAAPALPRSVNGRNHNDNFTCGRSYFLGPNSQLSLFMVDARVDAEFALHRTDRPDSIKVQLRESGIVDPSIYRILPASSVGNHVIYLSSVDELVINRDSAGAMDINPLGAPGRPSDRRSFVITIENGSYQIVDPGERLGAAAYLDRDEAVIFGGTPSYLEVDRAEGHYQVGDETSELYGIEDLRIGGEGDVLRLSASSSGEPVLRISGDLRNLEVNGVQKVLSDWQAAPAEIRAGIISSCIALSAALLGWVFPRLLAWASRREHLS